VLRALRLKYR